MISPAGHNPPIDAVSTSDPDPRRIISGYAAWTQCTTPRMFTSMIASHCPRVSSSVSPPQVMPALANMRSRPP
ncbi:hypothetical protein H483_0103520 [Dietzia sp. UCD-THP]|nr:hypothetical protein H483_0103520 [Dietzia sp. UCD-THP]